MIRRAWLILMGGGLVAAALGQEPGEADLRQYLEGMQERIEDAARPIAERQRLALEAAATLDRVAQGADSAEAQRRRWAAASALLDRFRAAQPEAARSREVALQAAVYRWARAWTACRLADEQPAREDLRKTAIGELGAVIAELRALLPATAGPATDLDANVGYRLAHALADRDRFAPRTADAGVRPDAEEALRCLPAEVRDPAFRGQVALLRADLEGRLGRFAEALAHVADAERAAPAPPRPEVVRVRAEALAGLDRADEALRLIDAAGLDPATRTRLAVRVLLTRWERLGPAADRRPVRDEITRRIAAVPGPESRPALVELARRLPAPEADTDPAAWEQLADGHLELGHLDRAADLLAAGADRAEALGRHDRAATLRYRAASVRLRAGGTAAALEILERLRNDPRAGQVRPRAGLLRALTLGRSGPPGAYRRALEDLVRDFPDDDAAAEARFRLGQLRAAAGDPDEAVRLWEAIPIGSQRGPESRLATVRLRLDALENRDPEFTRIADSDIKVLTSYLDGLGKDKAGVFTRPELDLARLRLELCPLVHHLDTADFVLNQLRAEPLREDQRSRLEGYALVLAARRSQYREAERLARDWRRSATPEAALEVARLLDRSGIWEEQDDVARRRYGGIALDLLDAAAGPALTPDEWTELLLLRIEALYLTGDGVRALRELDRAAPQPAGLTLPALRRLAQLQRRLGATEAALRTEEIRARRVPQGSKTWLDSRFALALTYLQAGQLQYARQVLDATELLHPDLGGPEGRERMEQLRERIRRRS
jgi:hypothetical protein